MPGSAEGMTELTILIKEEGSMASDFVDIRRNGPTLWVAQGRAFCVGESVVHEAPTAQAARDAESRLVAEKETEGFRVVHTASHRPGEFDFDRLGTAIRDGARQAYRRICADRAGERINGFALFTDLSGMTIGAAAMGTAWSQGEIEDANQYRTNFSEWPYSTNEGLLLAYRLLVVPAFGWMDIPFEQAVSDYTDRFFETCIRALEALDKKGAFGSGEERDAFVLLFGPSDRGCTQADFERLNPPRVRERYIDHFLY